MEPPGDCSFAGPAAFRFAGASGISAVLFPAGPAAPGPCGRLIYAAPRIRAGTVFSLIYTAAYTCLIQLSLLYQAGEAHKRHAHQRRRDKGDREPLEGLGDRGKLKPFADSRKKHDGKRKPKRAAHAVY